jgi:hypothetical protein
MKTVWKYPLALLDRQVLKAPLYAKPRLVAVQNEQACIWLEVETTNPVRDLVVHIEGTGHAIEHDGTHAGSFQDGPFVWHVYVELAK